MKVSFIILSAAALFYAHVARGDSTCKANVEGKDVTLQNGDRYCSDETTSRTCLGDDKFNDDKCPGNSKCLKSPNSYSVLCREVRRNAASSGGDQQQPTDQSPPSQPSQPKEQPSPPATQPEPTKPETPSQPRNEPAPAPAPAPADNKVDQAASPTTQPQKPETCTANIDGRDQTLQPGDRYCVDDKTHRVCNYGEFIDDKCPENSNCMKAKDQWRVLCRRMVTNAPYPTGPPAGEQSEKAAPSNSNSTSTRRKRSSPQIDDKTGDDKRSFPKPVPAQVASAAPEKPETCKANINGQEQTLKTGDRYCLDDRTHRVCNYGDLIDNPCPENSRCMKSPDSWNVLCRQMVTNAPYPTAPSDEKATATYPPQRK